MDYLLPVGVGLFVLGLVVSHIVLAVTRSAVRKKTGMKSSHRIMMWSSVGLVVLGLVLGLVGYFTAGES